MRQSAAAVGARTARACDSCLRKRARWYCAADDAFLCQACDSSVHSANQLARRHERVRLKTASSSTFKVEVAGEGGEVDPMAPSWHRAVKRKARTPRQPKQGKGGEQQQRQVGRMWPLVPELEEGALDDIAGVEEEDLIYRVPVFDPVLAEFCSPPESFDDGVGGGAADEKNPVVTPVVATPAERGLPGFLPSPPDMDMAEFALDVESLLGRGLDQESFCINDLGLTGSQDVGDTCRVSLVENSDMRVKKEEAVDDENLNFAGAEMDPSNGTFDINFGCGSPAANGGTDTVDTKRKRVMLSLDYEAVMNAWSTQGSPWADGERPRLDPDDCWLDNTEMMLGGRAEVGMVEGGHTTTALATVDVGREARVSRYREKRRTRLFSKKIRYEVRKLNAEKRPRMKGRFVKRASFTATAPAGGAASLPPPFVFQV